MLQRGWRVYAFRANLRWGKAAAFLAALMVFFLACTQNKHHMRSRGQSQIQEHPRQPLRVEMTLQCLLRMTIRRTSCKQFPCHVWTACWDGIFGLSQAACRDCCGEPRSCAAACPGRPLQAA